MLILALTCPGCMVRWCQAQGGDQGRRPPRPPSRRRAPGRSPSQDLGGNVLGTVQGLGGLDVNDFDVDLQKSSSLLFYIPSRQDNAVRCSYQCYQHYGNPDDQHPTHHPESWCDPPSWPSCWRSSPSCCSATSFPASIMLSKKPISLASYVLNILFLWSDNQPYQGKSLLMRSIQWILFILRSKGSKFLPIPTSAAACSWKVMSAA